MKTRSIKLVSSTTLALCGILLHAPSAMATEKDTLNATDVSFIKHAAADDMAEVKLGELGAKKAERPEVKTYAAMIVTDHTKSNADLAKLAAAKGVELSAVIEPDKATVFQKLEQSSGAEFDSKFLAEMVSDHKMCVSNFEKASNEATDSDVKAFASGLLPTLKAHLEKANELVKSMDAKTDNNTQNKQDSNVQSTNTAQNMQNPDVQSANTTQNMQNSDVQADNTARNARDRDGKNLTPGDQSNSKSDTEITAAIRREIRAGKDMSINAQNVKIITQSGKVTLRGPVNTEDEKRLIAESAGRIVNPDQVDCQLEVK